MNNLVPSLFLSLLLSATPSMAQTVLGDMNDDGKVDMSDVTQSVSTVLGTSPLRSIDPFREDNTVILGSWTSPAACLTFSADGSTSYGTGFTYKYLPQQGRILILDAAGAIVKVYNLLYRTDNYITLNVLGSPDFTNFYKGTRLSALSLNRTAITSTKGRSFTLTASLSPADAAITSLLWTSSDETVATVTQKGRVSLVGSGKCTITASAQDGSGLSASCSVTVKATQQALDANGHDYVDLGITDANGNAVYFATMNVGASTLSANGDYFAWGETTPQPTSRFFWTTYAWGNGSTASLTKYCNDATYGTPDNLTSLALSDDAARTNWGGDWRIPTEAEFAQLRTLCQWTWTVQDGHYGYLISSDEASIFLPAAGFLSQGKLNGANTGAYWTNTLNTTDNTYATAVGFNATTVSQTKALRYQGLPIRPVLAPSPK